MVETRGSHVREHHKLDFVLNHDNFELLDHHRNTRGDLTMVFMNKNTGKKLSFPNVNPDHIPRDYLSGRRSTGQHRMHHTLDEIRNDADYDEIDSHLNAYGNMTYVYENKKTGEEVVFPNVSI